MTIVAHAHPFVVGVDTHARTHALAILAAPTGDWSSTKPVPGHQRGLARAIAWVGRRTGGDLATLWVIEGIGTYGARLACGRSRSGYSLSRRPGWTPAPTAALASPTPSTPAASLQRSCRSSSIELRSPRRDEGVRAALRVLVTAREHMTTERTAAINALTALLRVVDLGIDARKALTCRADRRGRPRGAPESEDLATASHEPKRSGWPSASSPWTRSSRPNTATMTHLIQQSPQVLLDKTGIGPVTAAVVLAAWSHAGRVSLRSRVRALAGVNPIPASSGNTVRHRLNRGGDRRLNRALHMAVITRMAHDPDTRAYVERRRAEGRTTREIRRMPQALPRPPALPAAERHRVGPTRRIRRLTRHRRITVIIDLTPVRDGIGPARLLDMVEGRSKQVFKTWLDAAERRRSATGSRWSRWTGSPGSRPPPPKWCPTRSR